MADTELVIKIPEEYYKSIKDDAKKFLSKSMKVPSLYEKVIKGTPLPKGHGKLIDADAYRKELRKEIPNLDYDDSLEPYEEGIYSAIMSLDDAPIVLEADKGENK